MTIVGILIAIAVISIIGYFIKLKMRSRLSDGLGRKAKDHELTSLNSWMEASPDKQKNFKEYTPAKNAVDKQETDGTTQDGNASD